MTGVSETTGTLSAALAQARKLVAANPPLAEEQARVILKAVPGHPEALLLLAMARLRQDDAAARLPPFSNRLSNAQAKAPAVQYELGLR